MMGYYEGTGTLPSRKNFDRLPPGADTLDKMKKNQRNDIFFILLLIPTFIVVWLWVRRQCACSLKFCKGQLTNLFGVNNCVFTPADFITSKLACQFWCFFIYFVRRCQRREGDGQNSCVMAEYRSLHNIRAISAVDATRASPAESARLLIPFSSEL